MLGDRDYMRAEFRGDGSPRQGPSLIAIIIWINIAVWVMQLFFGVGLISPEEIRDGRIPGFVAEYRTETPDGGVSRWALQHGQVYRLVTYMFVHDLNNPFHIICNMLIVFFAGKRVLSILGPRHTLAIYLAGGILGALAQLALGESYLVGASAGAFALLCAFATLMPEMELLMLLYFILPVRMRAKFLALGMVGISVILLVASLLFKMDTNIAHLAHIGGALLGWYYVRALGYGGRTVSLADLRKIRARNRDMEADAEKRERWAGRFGKGKGKEKEKGNIIDAKVVKSSENSLTDDVDRVLDKIIREGFQSLTKEERRILEEGSEYISRRVKGR